MPFPRALLMAGLLVVPLAPWAGADAHCDVETTTTNVLPLAGYYVRKHAGITSGGEVWKESNDVPGLQMSDSFCAGGGVIPRDTFVDRF